MCAMFENSREFIDIINSPLYSATSSSNTQDYTSVASPNPSNSYPPTVLIQLSQYPHFEGFNYLYCDGHVKWLKPQNTFGKNPVTGVRSTNYRYPLGPWTTSEADDI